MYAKVKDGSVVQYPFTHADLQAQQPDASIPASWSPEFMADKGIVHVVIKGHPKFDPATQIAVEGKPVFNKSKNQWEQSWKVRELTDAERRARVPAAVSMRQARLAMLRAGLLRSVNEAVAALPGDDGEAARIEWEYATEVGRHSPLVTSVAGALKLSAAEIDRLFIAAAGL